MTYYCTHCKAFSVDKMITRQNTVLYVCSLCGAEHDENSGITLMNEMTMQVFPGGEHTIPDRFNKFKDKRS